MRVDKIVKNAKVFTSNKEALEATAFAVKDGKFVYVGDEAGLKDYEGEVVDLGGKFVMPAFLDAHVHLPACTGGLSEGAPHFIESTNKEGCLKLMKDYVKSNPDQKRYGFMMTLSSLGGETLTKEDLDTVSSDKEVLVVESEMHSSWSNSVILKNMGITDDTPDMAKGLSYYVRDENGHITGNCFEGPHFCIVMRHADEVTKDMMEREFERWVEYCKKMGISAVFEAGTPGSADLTERGLQVLCDMDRKGKLPIIIEGSYMVYNPAQAPNAINELIRQNKQYNTEHVKVNTLKLLFDGTMNIRTANMVEPYEDTHTVGGRLFEAEQVAEFLREINKLGFDLHAHCVSEGSNRTVLDAVEIVKKELGDDFHVQVTTAHDELMTDEDIPRFKELGVIANFTPWWHSGTCIAGGYEGGKKFLGKRIDKMYRSKTLWDTGATVCWSCDTTTFGDFGTWNPMLGIEVGITRKITEKTNVHMDDGMSDIPFPSLKEAMSIEEMLIGYTINNATQLRLQDRKGSIEVGKDADYIVFAKDLREVAHDELSYQVPEQFVLQGEKIK